MNLLCSIDSAPKSAQLWYAALPSHVLLQSTVNNGFCSTALDKPSNDDTGSVLLPVLYTATMHYEWIIKTWQRATLGSKHTFPKVIHFVKGADDGVVNPLGDWEYIFFAYEATFTLTTIYTSAINLLIYQCKEEILTYQGESSSWQQLLDIVFFHPVKHGETLC